MMRAQNRIQSKVQSIAQLAFYPLPTKPTKIARAVRYDSTHVLVGENGRIYTSQVRAFCYWTTVQRMNNTVQALIRLGMLAPEAVKQHNEAQAADAATRKRRWAADAVLREAEDAGIKLTVAQRRKLEAALATNETDERG